MANTLGRDGCIQFWGGTLVCVGGSFVIFVGHILLPTTYLAKYAAFEPWYIIAFKYIPM